MDEERIGAEDVGDVTAVLGAPAPPPRDPRPVAQALAPFVQAAAAATGADPTTVLGVAVAVGEFGITGARAVAIGAAVAASIPDPLPFLEACRKAYNAAGAV